MRAEVDRGRRSGAPSTRPAPRRSYTLPWARPGGLRPPPSRRAPTGLAAAGWRARWRSWRLRSDPRSSASCTAHGARASSPTCDSKPQATHKASHILSFYATSILRPRASISRRTSVASFCVLVCSGGVLGQAEHDRHDAKTRKWRNSCFPHKSDSFPRVKTDHDRPTLAVEHWTPLVHSRPPSAKYWS